jgi:hypothetical protein
MESLPTCITSGDLGGSGEVRRDAYLSSRRNCDDHRLKSTHQGDSCALVSSARAGKFRLPLQYRMQLIEALLPLSKV